MEKAKSRCGYVAILGKPNVGKSTLLNTIVGQKVSITCHKRQTTRHTINGIKTNGDVQTVYVDTPGIHGKSTRVLNQYMNRVARSAALDVDVIAFLVSAETWGPDDEMVLKQVKQVDCPVVLVVNKIDEIKDRAVLMAKLQELASKMEFAAVVPISALKRDNVQQLEKVLEGFLPEGPHFYEEDTVTDKQDTFLIAEVIREKLFKQAHQEIPYSTTVMVEKIDNEGGLMTIHAAIFVEKKGQKAIIIGKDGSKLKSIGTSARMDLQKMYGCKILLKLWVKVKDAWADSERHMRSLGFD
jgi:GTP-binding protein Era